MIIKARKKPVVVEAIQFMGGNWKECLEFTGDKGAYEQVVSEKYLESYQIITIDTLEGKMKTGLGSYIVKGVQGEFYPVMPDIFHETYDIVDNKDELIEEVILFIDNNTEYHFKIHVDADDFYGYIGIGISHDSLSLEEVFSEARRLNRLIVKEGIKATIYADSLTN